MVNGQWLGLEQKLSQTAKKTKIIGLNHWLAGLVGFGYPQRIDM
jgi:hypothetical protein